MRVVWEERLEGQRQKQRWVCGTIIVFNLLILGVFKYYNFFVDNIDLLCQHAGFHFDWVTLNVILPVGISFYTFQAEKFTMRLDKMINNHIQKK